MGRSPWGAGHVGRGHCRAYDPPMQGARRHRLAVLFAVVIAGACSPATGDPGGSPTQGSPATSRDPEHPATLTPAAIAPGVESAGCSEGASPGSRTESFRHDGIDRTYDIVVPETERGVAMPVVLSFHGFTDSSVDHASRSGLAARAAADGFIAVFPRGSNVDGTTPPYFNIETVDDPSLADDVGFTAKILDRVEAELCVDRSRIFASGWSNGGMFAATLGCALSDRVAAVASVSGVHLLPDCRGRPMPIIVIHGSFDDMVPLSEEDVGPAADIRGIVRDLGGNGRRLGCHGRQRDVGQVLGRVVGETERMPAHRPGRGIGIRGADDGVPELPCGRRRGAPGGRGRWTRLAPGPRVGYDG